MSARLAGIALAVLGITLAGCAATVPAGTTPSQLCTLDALRWSHGFVPRASGEQCVTILDTVKLGQ